LLFLAFNSLAEIKNPSKYRVIDKTSQMAQMKGIGGLGVGNIIFSTQELPYLNEAGYTDIRDTFYFGEDTSIYFRMYYPGTIESMVEKLKSQVPGARANEFYGVLKVSSEVSSTDKTNMSWPMNLDTRGDWDQGSWQLLLYKGGEEQPFNGVDLSADNYVSGQEYTVAISIYIQFQTGVDLLTGEGIYTDYLISYGEFKYIKR